MICLSMAADQSRVNVLTSGWNCDWQSRNDFKYHWKFDTEECMVEFVQSTETADLGSQDIWPWFTK